LGKPFRIIALSQHAKFANEEVCKFCHRNGAESVEKIAQCLQSYLVRHLTLSVVLREDLFELALRLIDPVKGRSAKVTTGPASLAQQSADVDEGVQNVDIFFSAQIDQFCAKIRREPISSTLLKEICPEVFVG